jgi:hypothetical protein
MESRCTCRDSWAGDPVYKPACPVHSVSQSPTIKEIIEQAAKARRYELLITELILGIDAVQLDTCTQEDWDMLNESARKARNAIM